MEISQNFVVFSEYMNFNAALPPGFSDLLTALNGGLAGWLLVLLATTTATVLPCSRAAMLQQPSQTKALFHSLWLLSWLLPTLVVNSSKIVYDRNQVLVLGTETKVQFQYRYGSRNFFPKPKLFFQNFLISF